MVRISYMPKASAAAEDFRRIFKINGISTRMIQEDGSETGKIILSDGEKKEEIAQSYIHYIDGFFQKYFS